MLNVGVIFLPFFCMWWLLEVLTCLCLQLIWKKVVVLKCCGLIQYRFPSFLLKWGFIASYNFLLLGFRYNIHQEMIDLDYQHQQYIIIHVLDKKTHNIYEHINMYDASYVYTDVYSITLHWRYLNFSDPIFLLNYKTLLIWSR